MYSLGKNTKPGKKDFIKVNTVSSDEFFKFEVFFL